MNKKVVVLGGGTGLSTLLRGLKQFPLEISAIVSVCDDGKSTGKIRQEFNVPALGDIRRVLIALSETEPTVEKMFNHRFVTKGPFNGHTVGNILLAGMTQITGTVSDGVEELGKVLNLKGKVLPLTEESDNTLVAKMADGSVVEGEHNITAAKKKITKVYYKSKPIINKEAIKAISEADLIILSMGSLFTSVIPSIIPLQIKRAIDKSNAKIMHVCNMMTQPGETDNYKVSDHIKMLNKHLGKRKVEVVVANKGTIVPELIEKYSVLEQKDPVICDDDEIKKLKVKSIKNNYVIVHEEMIRHDTIRLAADIFSYLL